MTRLLIKERKEMSGTNYVLDTNIISYFIGGNEDIAPYFVDSNIYVSFITELELLSNPNFSTNDLEVLNGLLSTMHIVEINTPIKQQTIHFRKNFKLKLSDSIIAATADFLDCALVTADGSFNKLPLKIAFYPYHT